MFALDQAQIYSCWENMNFVTNLFIFKCDYFLKFWVLDFGLLVVLSLASCPCQCSDNMHELNCPLLILNCLNEKPNILRVSAASVEIFKEGLKSRNQQ